MLESPKAIHYHQGEKMIDETMGNQQEMSEIELVWLAGLLNGDGCFSLTFRTRQNKLKCDMSLTLTQCDAAVIDKADSTFTKIGIVSGISEYASSGAGVRTKWNLRISKMAHISRAIDAVIPYMTGEKAAQARLMKRYLDRRMPFADPKFRKGSDIDKDIDSLKIAAEFYTVRRLEVPKELAQVLRDYPQGVGSSDPKCTAP